jgi:hypothetical protein
MIPRAGPVACGVLPAACGVLPAADGVLPAAGPEDVAAAEQALIPSMAATATVSAAVALLTPWFERPRRRDKDMPSMMPDKIRCLAQRARSR